MPTYMSASLLLLPMLSAAEAASSERSSARRSMMTELDHSVAALEEAPVGHGLEKDRVRTENEFIDAGGEAPLKNFCTSCCQYNDGDRAQYSTYDKDGDITYDNTLDHDQLGVVVGGSHAFDTSVPMSCQASGKQSYSAGFGVGRHSTSCNIHWTVGDTARGSDCREFCGTKCGEGGGRKSVQLRSAPLLTASSHPGGQAGYDEYMRQRTRNAIGDLQHGGVIYMGDTVNGQHDKWFGSLEVKSGKQESLHKKGEDDRDEKELARVDETAMRDQLEAAVAEEGEEVTKRTHVNEKKEKLARGASCGAPGQWWSKCDSGLSCTKCNGNFCVCE